MPDFSCAGGASARSHSASVQGGACSEIAAAAVRAPQKACDRNELAFRSHFMGRPPPAPPSDSLVGEGRHAGQVLAFEQLERGAAARGAVADLVDDLVL